MADASAPDPFRKPLQGLNVFILMGAIWVKGFKYCTGEKGDNPPPAIGQASDSSSLHIGHINLINFSKHI